MDILNCSCYGWKDYQYILTRMGRNMEALHLYKAMLRESQKFASYNIRNYALRRIRDAFKENKTLSNNPIATENQMKEAIRNFNLIKRQVVIGNMYQTHKLVIEKDKVEHHFVPQN